MIMIINLSKSKAEQVGSARCNLLSSGGCSLKQRVRKFFGCRSVASGCNKAFQCPGCVGNLTGVLFLQPRRIRPDFFLRLRSIVPGSKADMKIDQWEELDGSVRLLFVSVGSAALFGTISLFSSSLFPAPAGARWWLWRNRIESFIHASIVSALLIYV